MEDIEWFDYPDIINPPDDLELLEEEEIEDGGDSNGTRLTNNELDIITARVAESLIVPLQAFTQQANAGISPLISTSQYAYLNGRVNTAFSRIASNDSKIASAVGSINSTRSTVNSVNSTVKSHGTNISSLKGNVQKLMSWQTSANSKLNQLTGIKSDISALKSWRTSHTSAFNSLKSTVTSQGTRLNTVETWKAGAASTISSHTSRLNTLESWRSSHDTWAGNLSKRVDGLEGWKTTTNGILSSVGTRVNNLESWKSTISGTVSNLTTRMGNIESWKTSFVDSQNSLNTNQSDRISNLENKLEAKRINSIDLNELTETGLYRVVSITANSPLNDRKSYWSIEVSNVSGSIIQKAYIDKEPHKQYQRSWNGAWSNWIKIADENDLIKLEEKDMQLSESIKKEVSDRQTAISQIKNNLTDIEGSVNILKAFEATQLLWNKNQSDRISKIENTLESKRLKEADLNDLTATGLYRVESVTANSPLNERKTYWSIEVSNMSGSVIQKAYIDKEPHKQYQRSWNGAWSNWIKIVDENDLIKLEEKDTQLSESIKQEVSDRQNVISQIKSNLTDIEGSVNILKAFEATQLLWNKNQSDRISKIENTLESKRLKEADLNDLTATGLYRVETVTANSPLNERKTYWSVEVSNMSGSVIQKAYIDKEPHKQYQRSRNGVWTKWVKIADENDIQKSNDKLMLLLTAETAERQNDINSLNEKIDNFSDNALGIIAAIVASMKSNEDLWNAENYSGGSVGEKDGKAVRMFKVQFQESRSHFALLMKHYFDMNDPNSAIYKLRYSIVAGFEETKILLEEWFTYLLQSGNTTNSFLSTIADWLEMIYKKPPPVVNVTIPKVELDENGNGWLKTLIKTVGDVMKTAIETLGSLLETAIGEVGQLLRDLLTFLDGLIDDLLHLIVPENLDFMDRKFDDTSRTIKLKFGSIFDGIDSFKNMFNGRSTFKDIEISLGVFGNGSFEIPVSILNTLAPFVYPLITGGVALEFLIDMYKWFHTKGEIVE
ncbi:hypothetical protein KQI58_09780 [Enterococcus raffinosus]|uniref:pyocin knob domain-containing protein n=1 Tax=Enterococcus raffinosus TaxID=71452 RepID=UPI001C11B9B8|nr:pyocin knob domain-containing protein [Enterococcus raffinosus]MBU5361365.1 hypothetical protein [Enterococcus raffinosus]